MPEFPEDFKRIGKKPKKRFHTETRPVDEKYCSNKQHKFHTLKQAKAQAKKMNHIGLGKGSVFVAYKCPVCSGFHLATGPKK